MSLSKNQLTIIPPEIGQLANLETLCLSHTPLTTIPREIGHLANLTFLDLSGNKLTALPPEIGQLANLQTLSLSHNQLTTIPREIGQLANLTFLDLSVNQLTTIPPEISQLATLQALDLSVNQLTTVPPEIGQLANLIFLDLFNNQLIILPPEIVQLSRLENNYDHDNQHTTMSLELRAMNHKIELEYRRPQQSINVSVDRVTKNKENNDNTRLAEPVFKITIAHPLNLSKRFASPFLVQLHLLEVEHIAKEKRLKTLGSQAVTHPYNTDLKFEQVVKIKLHSPDIAFPDPIIKKITSYADSTILGKPLDTCKPGKHLVSISITDNITNTEINSEVFSVSVVDFAFDHVSLPLLSRISTIILALGSFTMFTLTFLEQIDKTLGVTSGTLGGVLSVAIAVNFYNLYQRIRPNTP